MDSNYVMLKRDRRVRDIIVVLAIVAVGTGVTLLWMSMSRVDSSMAQLATGIAFTLSVVLVLWLLLDPDSHTARQSDDLLKLASVMLDCMKGGFDDEAAQKICELLLPATPAIAVAITDSKVIMGYAGYNQKNNPAGTPIRTTATRETIEDGSPRILYRTDDIGLPMSSARISAAIVQPLFMGETIVGTLKFYFRKASQINETQKSVAHGFAELLSTQLAASALEEQTKLATSMELKALQAQINPHFLFNTINTIASFIRTDPTKARELLREFAVFYRSTLEDAHDLIPLERELKQVERYFMFEMARFGEERLELVMEIDPEVESTLVPSFMVQPLVENAVKHAMKAEGKLVIRVEGFVEEREETEFIIIRIVDNGVGMSEYQVEHMMDGESTTGLGIAVRNVRDRIRGYFGPEARMEIESNLGFGTTVTIVLDRKIAEEGGYLDADAIEESAVPHIPSPVEG